MTTPLQQQLSHLAAQAVAAHGLVLVNAQLAGSGKFLTLQVLAENPDGSSPGADDCARASRTLSAQLDVADLIKGRYVLEVSSPGLDRPLNTPADYSRFLGRQARLSFTQAQPVPQSGKNGETTQQLGAVTGHIIAADNTTVTLATRDSGLHASFAYSVIRQAELTSSAAEMDLFMKRQPLPGDVIGTRFDETASDSEPSDSENSPQLNA